MPALPLNIDQKWYNGHDYLPQQIALNSAPLPTNAEASAAVKPIAQALRRAAPAVAAALEGRVAKERGDTLEKRGLDKAAATQKIDFVQRGNTRFMNIGVVEHNGKTWAMQLVGKIDAFDPSSGEVVEHKQRRNCLFGRVKQYEQIQLEAYLRLYDCERGRLVETCDADQMHHCVHRDDKLWADVVRRITETITTHIIAPYCRALKV